LKEAFKNRELGRISGPMVKEVVGGFLELGYI
jgi:hypothetical protein